MDLSTVMDNKDQDIAKIRKVLDSLSRERYSAAESGDEGKLFKARVELAEVALRVCSSISDRIRSVSAAAANEMAEKVRMATLDFEAPKKTGSLEAVHRWYTECLAPLWNKAEQELLLISRLGGKKRAPKSRSHRSKEP